MVKQTSLAAAHEADVPDGFLIVEELAERWRTTPAGIHNLKYRGCAPRSYRLGRRTLYRLVDVLAFEETRAS